MSTGFLLTRETPGCDGGGGVGLPATAIAVKNADDQYGKRRLADSHPDLIPAVKPTDAMRIQTAELPQD